MVQADPSRLEAGVEGELIGEQSLHLTASARARRAATRAGQANSHPAFLVSRLPLRGPRPYGASSRTPPLRSASTST